MIYRSAWRLVAWMLLTTCFAGCGGGNTHAKYVPSPTAARDALQTALDTWKSGAGLNPIPTSTVVINVYDARWRDRIRLQSFEILEEVPNSEHPEFKVRMQLKDHPEETISYHVIGLDPLHVFRDEDYKQSQTW